MSRILTLPKPDVLVAARPRVGEGPVIDGRSGRLCWVDIPEGVLHEHDIESGQDWSATLPMQLGAVAPRENEEGFAVAVEDGFGLFVSGELHLIDRALPEPYRRMNDAKCDSAGRLWAGSTHTEYLAGFGRLHRWDGNGPSVVTGDGFVLPNGIGWSPDDSTMYLVDSFANLLLRSRFDSADGEVGEFEILRRIEPGFPDGLAVDQEGCIWVAIWGDGKVCRYSPHGDLLAIVPMPVSQPSSCAFGHDGTLYITSATEGLSEEDLAKQPHAGSVFALATTTSGVPVAPFAG
ncbi:MAG: hypothetical protein CVT68_01525 [Actinobacteria bacterium HGW-Actinobacteria-8]|nr:MAG: hypothetical protein CVT68_01525 [Actinobacteria bacterium HGW-Actinobacteria-8]